MKRHNYLKGLRVSLAILFFVPILLFFVDFANILPNSIHTLLHIQIVPAILSGMVGIFIFQLILALLFGRIYCSVICPAGVLQDIINRIWSIGKKKKNSTYRYYYHKPINWLRYTILTLTFVLGIFGIIELCLLLDPYSNFGRIANNIFRPIVMWGNNLLAEVFMKFDNYSLYSVTVHTVTSAALISAIIAFLVFITMVIFRGRLYCNTLCPVGTLLSLISRYSFFKISFDKEACTHCGLCEKTCKAEAINSKELSVDTSRCVDCFNCISSCTKGGLQYRFLPFYKKEKAVITANNMTKKNKIADRRNFFVTGATILATLPIVSALAEGKRKRKRGNNNINKGICKSENGKNWPPITPPGSISLDRFKDICTGCQICVVKCPSQVLRPAGLQFGFDYLLKPYVSYNNSYCNYECTVCADVCPTRAIKPLTKEEKATTQVGIAHFFKGRCIVHTEGTDCGACSEHCPTQAVRMIPYKGTLTIPHINPDLCIGCGGCESICPVRPLRAIIIEANEIHQHVEKPEAGEERKVEIEDFGF